MLTVSNQVFLLTEIAGLLRQQPGQHRELQPVPPHKVMATRSCSSHFCGLQYWTLYIYQGICWRFPGFES